MATAEQVKTLIKSYLGNERARFCTTALQVAAHEAMQGHQAVAKEIRDLVDSAKVRHQPEVVPYTPDFENLVTLVDGEIYKNAIVLSESIRRDLDRLMREYKERTKLERFGLQYRRKILLVGPPGTGKTMTASVLAAQLQLPLYRVRLDKIITKFMGETSAKLRLLFDSMQDRKGIYFFDEFDAIGSSRSDDNDVGEMRRVINSFLQFIEQDLSGSIILAATNNPRLLDSAMFRRFDDILEYALPEKEQIIILIQNSLGQFAENGTFDESVAAAAHNLCHAEIVKACNDAIKDVILNDKSHVTKELLLCMIEARKAFRKSSCTGALR